MNGPHGPQTKSNSNSSIQNHMKTASTIHALLLGLLVSSAAAQTSDPGDPPNLKRYEGSTIIDQRLEKYTPYRVFLSKWSIMPGVDIEECYTNKIDLEGALTRITYAIPDLERTVVEVQRNYLDELPRSGWEILFEGKGERGLHANFGAQTRLRDPLEKSQILSYPDREETAYVAARRTDADGDTYATFLITRYGNGLRGPFEGIVKKDMILVRADVLKPRAMEQRMVFVDAKQMQGDIATKGRIALYGIQFDFNKADIKPDSKPTLDEIAKLLQDDAALKLLVVGHTDNVGTLDFNRDLSSRRAASVVKELTSTYGISSARLHAEGVAFLCPVDQNNTDEGRAKNRRVELVKW